MQNKKGFTLVEMLVVIGLTAIILGLFMAPLIEGLQFTHRTQTSVMAQDNARLALAQVSRDLSDAMYVYDNTHEPINFPMADIDGQELTAPPQALFAKIDMVLPRMKGYCVSPKHTTGVSREYKREDQTTLKSAAKFGTAPIEAAPLCPVDGSKLELRPIQPAVADTRVVRYFIGLADPSSPYVNPYPYDKDAPKKNSVPTKGMDSASSVATGEPMASNMYVLYRVEFNPMDPLLFPKYKTNASGNQVLRTLHDNLSDPNFFYSKETNPDSTYIDANGQKVAEPYWHAWKKICKAVVTVGDTDLINVKYGSSPSYTPTITPTISFAPTAIQNDPLVPTTQVGDEPERGELTSASASAPPTAYKGSYGHWVTTPVTVAGKTVSAYEVTLTGQRKNPSSGAQMTATYKTIYDSATGDMCIWYVDSANSGNNRVVFDMDQYMSPDPSTTAGQALLQYGIGEVSPKASDAIFGYVPGLNFLVDARKGLVNFAFPHIDTTVSSGNTRASFAVKTSDLNSIYNGAAVPEGAHRFWVFNHPGIATSGAYYTQASDQLLNNSTVVPGMEQVIGPDCNPGQSFGAPVVYTRIPFWNVNAEPGLNQYKVDTKYSDGRVSNGAAVYFMSNQTYKSGGTDVRLPETSNLAGLTYTTTTDIYMLYYEQNNQIGDSLRANYVTKELVTVTMGIQIYDPNDVGKPQSLQLTNKIRLRNIAS